MKSLSVLVDSTIEAVRAEFHERTKHEQQQGVKPEEQMRNKCSQTASSAFKYLSSKAFDTTDNIAFTNVQLADVCISTACPKRVVYVHLDSGYVGGSGHRFCILGVQLPSVTTPGGNILQFSSDAMYVIMQSNADIHMKYDEGENVYTLGGRPLTVMTAASFADWWKALLEAVKSGDAGKCMHVNKLVVKTNECFVRMAPVVV